MNSGQLRQKVPKQMHSISQEGDSDLAVLSQSQLVWRRFRKSRMGLLGGCVVVLLYLMAAFAGFLSPYHQSTQFIDRVHTPPQAIHFRDNEGWHWPFVYDFEMTFSENGLERLYRYDKSHRYPIRLFVTGEEYAFWGFWKSRTHLFGAPGVAWFPLGTDRMGRDLLSRILYGSRVSLTIGLFGVAISLFLGAVIGTISGYYSGWIDSVIQRLIELLLVFPSIPLWMALAAALPPYWSQLKIYFGIVTILSFVGWGGLARQVRGMVLSLRERDYVKAARSFGAGHTYILFRHLIPGCYSHLIVIATLAIPGMILGETALSFLDLGIRPPMTSWGVLLEESQHIRVLVQFPWLLLPALPVLLTVVAFNFLGDALRDAVDPYAS